MPMIKNILTASLILLLFLFTTCIKDKIAPVPYNTSFGVSGYAQAQEELKMYARWGVYTDGISELSLRTSTDARTEGEVFTKYRATLNSERSDGGIFYMNEIKSIYRDSRYIPELTNNSFSDVFEFGEYLKNNYFGKEVNFRLERGEETIYNKTLYVPPSVEILDFPNDGTFETSAFYQISRDNFSINWNGDQHNENGVLALLLWDGNFTSTTLLELGETSGDYYQKTMWLEDTGSEDIPASFFAEVPMGAIFRLILMRANIEIIRGADDKTYKVYGISEYKTSCVLMD